MLSSSGCLLDQTSASGYSCPPPRCKHGSLPWRAVYPLCLLLQRAEISVTQLHPSLAPRRPRGEGVMGAPGAGISMGPILTPCLPRSLAPQPLRPSCPPAPPQRPSRHCRCPRCVSVPPSPTMGGEKPTVSACSTPGLTVPPRERDDPHLACRISSQCQLCDSRHQSEGCHRVPHM